jgi:hypothetical protein
MPGLGKTGTARGSAPVSPARSQETYQRYAVVLYRQALLNLDDPASAGQVACDALVNECALAAIQGHGADDARRGLGYIRVGAGLGIRPREMAALVRAVLRKLTTSPSATSAENSDQP